MPTETFFNLPAAKKDKLTDAIRTELSRAPFDEVSINKIVAAAGIARGSFYQYFDDKYDMLGYILTEFRKKVLEKMKKCLIENGGDIFDLFFETLNFMTEFVFEEENNRFCKNLFCDIKVNTLFYKKVVKNKCYADKIKEIESYVDKTKLDLRVEDDFENMISILFSILKDASAATFLNLSDADNQKEIFRQKLEIVKRGFLKRSAN